MHTPQIQGKFELFSGSGGFSSFASQGGGSVSLSKSFGDYLSAETIHWNNLVFCAKAGGQCHLLLDHKAVICKAYFPGPPKDKSEVPRYLLLGIAEEDTNGDGYINDQDAVVLFVADLAGRNLIRLTP